MAVVLRPLVLVPLLLVTVAVSAVTALVVLPGPARAPTVTSQPTVTSRPTAPVLTASPSASARNPVPTASGLAAPPTGTVDPRPPVAARRPSMRGVHLTGLAWTSPALRNPILALIKTGQIDTVQLDLKDEDGAVGYASTNPLAVKIGAVRGWYDARSAIAQLHAAGARVVGRLVAFRDPTLAGWAHRNGQRQMLVQTPAGGPYRSSYGPASFTNFADPQVRAYNIDLAVEAARLGFDDVLYDYCRRPDGPRAGMVIPGLSGSPAGSITTFMRDSQRALRPLGTYLGASVFGIAADRPDEIAQNVPELAKYVDFIAPMVYPSHWAKGEYGVADPNRQPAQIVSRSLAVFQRKLAGSPVVLVPWLQDFSLGGVHYGPDQVRAQIQAARSLGITSFLLWNAGARYQAAALTRRATPSR